MRGGLVAVAIAMVVGWSAEAAAGIQDFTVRNNGSTTVFYIYVSPDYSDDWEEDVLGDDVLMPKSQIGITMTGYGKHCMFDIKVEDENGYYVEYMDVDLCSVTYIDFP